MDKVQLLFISTKQHFILMQRPDFLASSVRFNLMQFAITTALTTFQKKTNLMLQLLSVGENSIGANDQ